MGREKIPLLKEGLQSEHALVRFASAEALAYLGSTAGVETLTQVSQQHPIFATHATLANAVAGEADDALIGHGELGADGGGEAEAHGA